MVYDPDCHRRRSIRLKGYNYASPGAYFVTVCVRDRQCLFGKISGGRMQMNAYGKIVQAVWDGLPDHYAHVTLDAFVVMPNHVHAVVVLDDWGFGVDGVWRAGLKPAPTGGRRHGLPEIVRAFKTFSSRQVNRVRATSGTAVWQRNYYEHIVRDDLSLQNIRRYIHNNPAKWNRDRNRRF